MQEALSSNEPMRDLLAMIKNLTEMALLGNLQTVEEDAWLGLDRIADFRQSQ